MIRGRLPSLHPVVKRIVGVRFLKTNSIRYTSGFSSTTRSSSTFPAACGSRFSSSIADKLPIPQSSHSRPSNSPSLQAYLDDIKSVIRGFQHLLQTNRDLQSIAHLLLPVLFAKAPKGFEKFFPEETEKDSKSETEKQADPDKKSNNENDPRPTPENDDKNGDGNNGGGQPSNQAFLTFIVFLVFCSLFSYLSDNHAIRSTGANQINIQTFLNDYLAKGYVKKVDVVNKEIARITLRPDAPSEAQPSNGEQLTFRIGSVDSFEAKLESFQYSLGLHPTAFVPVQHVEEVNLVSEFVSYIPTLAVIGITIFLFRKLASVSANNDPSKFFKMGKANPMSSKDIKVKIKFSDVAGMTEAKHEIKEFVDFLKDPKKYQKLGAHIPKGALLVGPPGTGKTLLAKAVAGEANVPFFSMSGSDFIEVFVGVGPSRVRDLFAKARKNAPSIVFIDEIDAVGRKRAKGGFAGGANDERENTLNQMLVEMDGFTTSTGVVVLAGTNRADILDPALTRPGRFDRTVNIEKPDLAERTEIFKIHMKPIKMNPNLDPEETNKRLAALTPGFVGADIQNICNEAAIYAARRDAPSVDILDFENACERVMGGMKKSTGFINEDLKRVIAFHEAGHAVAGWFLKYGDPVLKVSIVPRTNGALGFAQNLPEEVQLLPQQQVLDKIAILLGGRVSEELNVGRISTGASDDLEKVTRLAYAFVGVWGFNPTVGLMSFQHREDSPQYYKPYSEHLAQVIDKEVKEMIDTQYERVKTLLKQKSDVLHSLTNRLMAKETITFHDLREVLGERPFPMKPEYAKYIEATPQRPDHPASEESKIDDTAASNLVLLSPAVF